jgi:hypothetical protein
MNIREDDRVSAVALVMEDEAATPESAETVDPDTLGAGVVGVELETGVETDADALADAGPADPTDPATITPPEVDTEDIEP